MCFSSLPTSLWEGWHTWLLISASVFKVQVGKVAWDFVYTYTQKMGELFTSETSECSTYLLGVRTQELTQYQWLLITQLTLRLSRSLRNMLNVPFSEEILREAVGSWNGVKCTNDRWILSLKGFERNSCGLIGIRTRHLLGETEDVH